MNDTTPPRQLILLCDGTNNNLTGGERDTNLVKLAELLARHPSEARLVFYDPGVGNPGELPGATIVDNIRRRYERIAGLAVGRGVYENIAECYRFLMQHWEAGDQLFIFGFSRGAFTARSVAGLVNQFGLLAPHMDSMLPTLLHIYFSERGDARWKRIAAQAARLFAGAQSRQVEIHYIGVWDTVAAVGMPPFRLQFSSSADVTGKSYLHVRQALALDEHRAQFVPRLYAQGNGPVTTRSGRAGSLVQLWFRGAHCDIGGGYAPGEAVLSDQALIWIVGEAARLGLRLGPAQARLVDENAVAVALGALPPVPEMREPVVHSEMHGNCLWALTGMAQRDTTTIPVADEPNASVDAHEHPSVASSTGPQPAVSIWKRPRRSRGMWLALLSLPLWSLLLGQMLQDLPVAAGSPWDSLGNAGRVAAAWLHADALFQLWQFMGLVPPLWQSLASGFTSPRWALLWDLGFIACYAYVLAYAASWAFARRAGWRKAGQPVSKWLNRLGWALPLAVASDLAENAFTWAALTLWQQQWPSLATASAVIMASAALSKWIGLLGVAWLVLWGLLPARRI